MELDFQRRLAEFWSLTKANTGGRVNNLFHTWVVYETEDRKRLGIVITTPDGEHIFVRDMNVLQIDSIAKKLDTKEQSYYWEYRAKELKQTFQSIKSNPKVVENIPIYDPTNWRGYRFVKEKTPALRQP